MVLISIHPFALRRLVLVLLALVGFSALCFADPVLMANRYCAEKSRAPRAEGSAVDRVSLVPQSTDIILPIFADKATPSLDNPMFPPVSFTPLISQNWGSDLRINAFPEIASGSRFTLATTTN